jgi:hypothetical protein
MFRKEYQERNDEDLRREEGLKHANDDYIERDELSKSDKINDMIEIRRSPGHEAP